MPFGLVQLYKILLDLRELVFPTQLIAALYERDYPGLLPGLIASIAHECWMKGELPLWGRAQDADIAQIAWHPGRRIEWPDTTIPVAIVEYPYDRFQHIRGEKPLHRRDDILTSTAGARLLRRVVRGALSKRPTGASQAETEQFLRELGAKSEEEAWKLTQRHFCGRVPPRSRFRAARTDAQRKDESLKPKRGRPPKI